MPWNESYQKRTKKLQVWLRQDEEDGLRERAIAAGYKTIPAYLRAVGLGGWHPVPPEESEELEAVAALDPDNPPE